MKRTPAELRRAAQARLPTTPPPSPQTQSVSSYVTTRGRRTNATLNCTHVLPAVRVTEEQAAAVGAFSNAHGLSLSGAIRELLARGLAEEAP